MKAAVHKLLGYSDSWLKYFEVLLNRLIYQNSNDLDLYARNDLDYFAREDQSCIKDMLQKPFKWKMMYRLIICAKCQ
jgi:hypothetical protein